jgi:hypothetical protein
MHGSKDVSIGLVSETIKEAGVTVEEWLALSQLEKRSDERLPGRATPFNLLTYPTPNFNLPPPRMLSYAPCQP